MSTKYWCWWWHSGMYGDGNSQHHHEPVRLRLLHAAAYSWPDVIWYIRDWPSLQEPRGVHAAVVAGLLLDWTIFTAQRSYASAVLGVVILPVCLTVFVRLSVTCVLCDKTKQCLTDILMSYKRAITLVFWHQQCLVGDALFRQKFALKVTHPFKKRRLRQISGYNVSTV